MLLAGTYRYVDFPGAEPQLVEVDWELGHCVVRFHDMEPEDAGIILYAQDMAGTFERVR